MKNRLRQAVLPFCTQSHSVHASGRPGPATCGHVLARTVYTRSCAGARPFHSFMQLTVQWKVSKINVVNVEVNLIYTSQHIALQDTGHGKKSHIIFACFVVFESLANVHKWSMI